MTCYHPLIRLEEREKYVTAQDGHKYHKATIVKPDKFELDSFADTQKYRKQLIPCGKCIGCRLDYSREWANRGYLESLLWEQNWFVTITYDEDHITIPDWVEDSNGFTYTDDGEWNGTLVPKDLTQFIKNVRQIMKREHDQDNIRFMACGEYGGETARPHYHIIFFNLNLPVEDLHHPKIRNKEIYYESHIIDRAWGGERYLDKARTLVNPKSKGIADVSECSWNTIAYVARYITKKINGKQSEEHYNSRGQIKEFFRVSRMPGIGEGYYQKHWEKIYSEDRILIHNRTGTQYYKPPKYFDDLYKAEHPEAFKVIQKKRQYEAKTQAKLKDLQSSYFRQEQLDIEERSKTEQNMKLKRVLESQKQK